MLSTFGPAAERVADLWWLMFALGAAVYVVVLAILFAPVVRARRSRPSVAADPRHDDAEGENRRGARWVLIGGFAIPLALVAIVFGASLHALNALHPRTSPDDLVVHVTGRQWWWEIGYPGAGPSDRFGGANEIHIPVGRRVRIHLESADVIHSLWIPALAGKTDLIPGRRNVMWLEAKQPGIYRGQCAEFCGLQHTVMEVLVVAHAPADYERWRAAQGAPAAAPADSLAREGQMVFVSRCAVCHTVRGTPARGRVGPDLTHFASRRMIAAGLAPNRRGFLSGWITNPRHLKPGTQMPATPLEGPQLQALVHYLESLR